MGFCLIKQEGSNLKYHNSGVLRLKAKIFYEKMRESRDFFLKMIDEYSPDTMVIEEGFLGKNFQSSDILSMLRGVLISVSLEKNLLFASYPPRVIKKSLTGNGNSQKSQVSYMVKKIFNIAKDLSPDESDALAIAYTHILNRNKYDLCNQG